MPIARELPPAPVSGGDDPGAASLVEPRDSFAARLLVGHRDLDLRQVLGHDVGQVEGRVPAAFVAVEAHRGASGTRFGQEVTFLLIGDSPQYDA